MLTNFRYQNPENHLCRKIVAVDTELRMRYFRKFNFLYTEKDFLSQSAFPRIFFLRNDNSLIWNYHKVLSFCNMRLFFNQQRGKIVYLCKLQFSSVMWRFLMVYFSENVNKNDTKCSDNIFVYLFKAWQGVSPSGPVLKQT